jgi:hypothetical protein
VLRRKTSQPSILLYFFPACKWVSWLRGGGLGGKALQQGDG